MSEVKPVHPSLNFAQYASQQIPEVKFLVSDGAKLALQDMTFDGVVSGLALNFMPAPTNALTDMWRITKPGGTVAAYVWDYAGKMEFLRYFWDAACELDDRAIQLHEGNRFPICQQDALHQLWQNAGLNNIHVEAIDIPTRFDTFDAYWQPFTLGNFPAPNYVTSLTEVNREKLKSHLQASIPTEEDGSINLIARVWAISGTR